MENRTSCLHRIRSSSNFSKKIDPKVVQSFKNAVIIKIILFLLEFTPRKAEQAL